MRVDFFMAYLSPNGSTRIVADILLKQLHDIDLAVLDYQPDHLALEQKAKIEQPLTHIFKS